MGLAVVALVVAVALGVGAGRVSAAHREAPCPQRSSWAALPAKLPAIRIYRPTVVLGLPLTSLYVSLGYGTYGYAAGYGRGSTGFAISGGSFCASGEWGDFDASPVPARTVTVRGHRATLHTKQEPGALLTWTENGVGYLVGSHDLPAAEVLRVARALRPLASGGSAKRYCVVDTSPLNVRTAPGVQAPRIAAIPVGDCTVRDASSVPRLASAPNGRPWRQIVWHDWSGWVADSMLRAKR